MTIMILALKQFGFYLLGIILIIAVLILAIYRIVILNKK